MSWCAPRSLCNYINSTVNGYVRLAADVSAAFADEAAVNSALREYLSARQERQAANPS